MTPTALAERYIREAFRAEGGNAYQTCALALLMSCTDQLANSPSGFDRSATLARAAAHKAEETAQGPKHL